MPLQVIGVPFDILALTKESQSQHGVRNEDFGRYHRYLTNRLATLRRQTKTQQIPPATKAAAAKKRAAANAAVADGAAPAAFYREFAIESVMTMANISTSLLTTDATRNKDDKPPQQSLVNALSVALSLCPSRRSKASAASSLTVVAGGNMLTPNDNCSFIYAQSGAAGAAQQVDEADAITRQQQLATAASAVAGKAAGGKFLEVYILSAERCWAEYEELNRAPFDTPSAPVSSSRRAQARKRLNKAVKWCEALEELVKSLKAFAADASTKDPSNKEAAALGLLIEFVVSSVSGYVCDMRAKCASAHKDIVLSATSLVEARTAYMLATKAITDPALLAFLPPSSNGPLASEAVVSLEQTHALLVAKLGEIDDRILLVESTSKKDDIEAQDSAAVSALIKTYRASPAGANAPTFVIAAASSASASATLSSSSSASYITLGGSISWFSSDRKSTATSQIPVHNLRVKACLRQASIADPTNIARKLTATATDGTTAALPPLISLPCQRRINGLYDRTIHSLNDALAHARQEGRSVGGADRKTATQVLHLYLQYQIARKTADRALFLLEVLMRRLVYILNFIRTRTANNGSDASNLDITLDGLRLSRGFLKIKNAKRAELVKGSTAVRFFNSTGRSKVPVVSPTEMTHIYDIAIASLEEISHLPGIEGGGKVDIFEGKMNENSSSSIEELVEEQLNLCKVGKLACAGAAWQFIGVAPVAGNNTDDDSATTTIGVVPTSDLAIPQALQSLSRAAQAIEAAAASSSNNLVTVGNTIGANTTAAPTSFFSLTLSDSVGLPTVLHPASLSSIIDAQLLQLTIVMNNNQSGSGDTSSASTIISPASIFGSLSHLNSIQANSVTTNQIVPCFPPKPMPLVPKPVSIDVASIFISIPRGGGGSAKKTGGGGQQTSVTAKKGSAPATAGTDAQEGSAGKGWLGGWGWKAGGKS